MTVDSPNLGIAFALVIGAGLATVLGASVVFFPRLVKLLSKRVLASSLGFSAGVMIYLAFVDILPEARSSFEASGESENMAYIYTTLCFFGGVSCLLVADLFVRLLNKNSGGKAMAKSHDNQHTAGEIIQSSDGTREENETIVDVPHCIGCNTDPVAELENLHHQADEMISKLDRDRERLQENVLHTDGRENDGPDLEGGLPREAVNNLDRQDSQENEKLRTMGSKTAIAFALHNFPEGLATFVAALNNPQVGAVLAIAISIHNIPEGLCIALPIYYATGSRMTAFGWAVISGAPQPLAAVLGWAILANIVSEAMYAIMFGLVSGMLVTISIRELLPNAHRYDPEDTAVTNSFLVGTIVMAISLVLFVL